MVSVVRSNTERFHYIMTVRQIIDAYKALPVEEKQAVAEFINKPTTDTQAQGGDLSRDEVVKEAIDETFTEYDDLLRRLAQ